MEQQHDKIYVSGMPLMLRGFNGEYIKHPTKPDRWDREESLYMGLIPIRPTCIKKQEDKWILCTTDDWYPFKVASSNDLFGVWKDTFAHISITPTGGIGAWWNNNSSIIMSTATVASLLTALYAMYIM
jgi:hypothetical protein